MTNHPPSDTQPLIELAPAKINLALHVTGRRDDGYHLLDSVFVYTVHGDVLKATLADTLKLTVDGPFGNTLSGLSDPASNLVMRAAYALQSALGENYGAHLHLTKNLPLASGIGGGSSDAAATLRLLQCLWRKTLKHNRLHQIALSLGADVPPCLSPGPQHVSGVGEQVATLPVGTTAWVLLVNPLIGISTPTAFKAYQESGTAFSAGLTAVNFDGAVAGRNDLEPAAFSLVPVLRDGLDTLNSSNGALLARMSGSGATLFAIFKNEHEAQAAEQQFRSIYPGWWTMTDSVQLP